MKLVHIIILWEDLSNWCSSLKKKAHFFVHECYEWDTQNCHDVNAGIVRKLLEHGNFLKDGFDEEGHTNNLAHLALSALIIEFFYTGINAVANLFPEVFQSEVPHAAVAFTTTTIKVALDEVIAEGKDITFKHDVYVDVYADILSLMSKCDMFLIHCANTKACHVQWAKIGRQHAIRNGGSSGMATGFDICDCVTHANPNLGMLSFTCFVNIFHAEAWWNSVGQHCDNLDRDSQLGTLLGVAGDLGQLSSMVQSVQPGQMEGWNPLLSANPIPPLVNICPPQKASNMFPPSDASECNDTTGGLHNSQVVQAGGPPSCMAESSASMKMVLTIIFGTVMNTIMPHPSTVITSEPALQPAAQTLSGLVIQLITQKAPGPISQPLGTKKNKMWHPSLNKSARTLCMHHYWKQISRSLEEFNTYFEALSAEAKMRYKEEVKELVSHGMWINGMVDIIAKFSSLPMH
ncbi:hypothetical protein EDD17DRAFT_1512916 [Pisolithus thermaeus]|nr:hypothetical protein EDD17DRAFT_1512916 [Pisolithus thermaeus]